MSRIECFMVERVPDDPSPRGWRRVDTHEVLGHGQDLAAGAMWDAHWMGDGFRVNGSGPVLCVRLPNGADWMPGSQSSNCTRKGEDHDCWCVHGNEPVVTVDKVPAPGRSTCQAGAGSIGSGSGERYWHGFLRGGFLEEC